MTPSKPPFDIPWDRRRDPERPLPVPFRERLKIVLMAGSVFAAGLWLGSRVADGEHQGAAGAVALGAALAAIHIVQLVYLVHGKQSERIFIRTKRAAAFVYSGAVVFGLVLVAAGLARGA